MRIDVCGMQHIVMPRQLCLEPLLNVWGVVGRIGMWGYGMVVGITRKIIKEERRRNTQ